MFVIFGPKVSLMVFHLPFAFDVHQSVLSEIIFFCLRFPTIVYDINDDFSVLGIL